jgi:hypothetical protein
MNGRVAVWILGASLVGAGAASAGELRKSGTCKLQRGESTFDKNKAFAVTAANAEIEVSTSFVGSDFFDKFIVNAVPHVTNKTGKKLEVAYHVAFFDKSRNLVGAATQQTQLDEKEKDYQLGSALVFVPEAALASITSYEIVVYTAPPKSK